MFQVVLDCLVSMMGCTEMVAVREMGVVCGLFVIPGFMVSRRFLMVSRGMFMMLGGMPVMFGDAGNRTEHLILIAFPVDLIEH
jgi:hypothetical protein